MLHSSLNTTRRILSGMRPTGRLHLGHYHGVLTNWVKLQYQYESFFSIVDLHGLTTHYEDISSLHGHVFEMIIDWLAVGINPNVSNIFIQSRVPEIAQLHLILSMVTPLSWLERVPTYKDQITNLADRDLLTYGFLGYPVLQAADVLAFKAHLVPIGEDQLPHIELTREIARRFNHLYGREVGYEERVVDAIAKLNPQQAVLYQQLRKAYQEQGDVNSLERGRALIDALHYLTISDKERLLGHLEGGGRAIFPEPQALLQPISVFPGLDGRKMSKSYKNSIGLREEKEVVEQKIKKMPTDPARIRRSDPGEPLKCPVWQWHQVYYNDEKKAWVMNGCRSAGIGCLDCKQLVIDAILKEQAPIKERAKEFENNPRLIRQLLIRGSDRARAVASETLTEVYKVLDLDQLEK